MNNSDCVAVPRCWDELASRVLEGHRLTEEEALGILESPDRQLLEVLAAAYRVRGRKFDAASWAALMRRYASMRRASEGMYPRGSDPLIPRSTTQSTTTFFSFLIPGIGLVVSSRGSESMGLFATSSRALTCPPPRAPSQPLPGCAVSGPPTTNSVMS